MLSRFPALAMLCGAALLGWSLGGVSSVDRQLAQVREPPLHFVSGCHGHRGPEEV